MNGKYVVYRIEGFDKQSDEHVEEIEVTHLGLKRLRRLSGAPDHCVFADAWPLNEEAIARFERELGIRLKPAERDYTLEGFDLNFYGDYSEEE